MLPLSLKQTYNEIPESVKQFAKRALILMVGWLFVYHVILKPRHIPDNWLTDGTTNTTVLFLNKWYSIGFNTQTGYYTNEDGAVERQAVIVLNGKRALGVADGCNALELYILYIGFLLCIPTTTKRQLLFVLTGIAVIFILNITRLYALTWLSLSHPGFFDFAHHYAFTFIVYGCIFATWVWYSNNYARK